MRTKSYEEVLREELRDPDVAAEYLSAAVELRSIDALTDGLKHLIAAHGGIAPITEISGVSKEEIEKALDRSPNSPIQTLSKLLLAMGVTISFSPAEKK